MWDRAEQCVEEGGGYKRNRDTVGGRDGKSLTTGAEHREVTFLFGSQLSLGCREAGERQRESEASQEGAGLHPQPPPQSAHKETGAHPLR